MRSARSEEGTAAAADGIKARDDRTREKEGGGRFLDAHLAAAAALCTAMRSCRRLLSGSSVDTPLMVIAPEAGHKYRILCEMGNPPGPSTFLLGPFLYFCVLPSTPGSHRHPHPHPPPPPLLLLIDNPLEAFSGPRRNLGSQLFLSGEPVEALQSFPGFGLLLCSNRWVFSSRQR
ncbi:hypothetical protein CEP52_001803 [Fusarium oligoseptatum]|uniref:Uncharacterized protein n=1 Tax=Fusarium oligoseptatum TaxID=2604345 RepID=A0A428UH81_9HYPO|nr:hypothetical protein CEP52_001803 [Fusarium oligoseptatum]